MMVKEHNKIHTYLTLSECNSSLFVIVGAHSPWETAKDDAHDQRSNEPTQANAKNCLARIVSVVRLEFRDQRLVQQQNQQRGNHQPDVEIEPVFVNGAVLVAFSDAKSVGIEPPEKVVRRAIAAIGRQQKKDYSYLYGEYLKNRPMAGINRPGGSLGRTQCCNVALRLWGDNEITDNVLKNWLFRLYVRNGWLDIGRKRPIPHESWFQVAGYFYYFGHYYGALCVEQLSETDREPYQGMLAKLMVDRQEKDGSWWDYPLYNYHQPYGTAFALMTLKRSQ